MVSSETQVDIVETQDESQNTGRRNNVVSDQDAAELAFRPSVNCTQRVPFVDKVRAEEKQRRRRCRGRLRATGPPTSSVGLHKRPHGEGKGAAHTLFACSAAVHAHLQTQIKRGCASLNHILREKTHPRPNGQRS